MKRAILVLSNAIYDPMLEGDYIGADKGAFILLGWLHPCRFAIGDFDSVSQIEKELILNNANEVKLLNCHKDQSDMAEAMDWIESNDYEEVVLLSETTGRFDHTYACLQRLVKSSLPFTWIDSKNKIQILKSGKHKIQKEIYPYISFFSLEKGKITLKDVEYPLNNYEMDVLDSLGLSNVILNEFCLVENDMKVLCIQSKDK